MFTHIDKARFSVFYNSPDVDNPISSDEPPRPWPFSPIPPDLRGHIGQPGTMRYALDQITLGFQSAQLISNTVRRILQGMYPR